MITLENTPAILVLCVAFCVLAGLLVLTWERKLPRQGDWLAGVALLAFLVATLLGGNSLFEEGKSALTWQKGWIWPHAESGALTTGVLQDGLGLSMAALTAVVSLLAIFSRPLLDEQAKAGRYCSALSLGAAGVCLSWISLTPWLSFVGLALSILGGFISMSAHWQSDDEAILAVRFAWERTGGLLLSILGACGLAGVRSALLFGASSSDWAPHVAVNSYDKVSGLLLITGLLVQLQPFPFLGWLVSPSRASAWPKVLLTQIFPAWAAFAVLMRLSPQLSALSVLPILGWCMLGSTVLAVISGLLQSEWKAGLAAWTGAGLTLSAAVLAFSGPCAALSLLLGVSLGTMTVAMAGRARTHTTKAAAILGTCAATGMIGFVSAAGGLQWMTRAWQQPALVAAPLIVFFLYVLLAWKQLWTLLRAEGSPRVPWSAVLAPFVPILLSFGVVWTGSITGHALPGDLDQVFPSLFSTVFGSSLDTAVDGPTFAVVSSLFWAAILLGAAAGYWISLRLRSGPTHRVGQTIATGYGVDLGARKVLTGVTWFADRTQWLVDEKIWRQWIPLAIGSGVHGVAGLVSRADLAVTGFSRRALSRWIEAPAKLVQLIQSGDVQWYLVFAIGSGLAILAHFLKF